LRLSAAISSRRVSSPATGARGADRRVRSDIEIDENEPAFFGRGGKNSSISLSRPAPAAAVPAGE
jgi:hypothetical protein